MLKSPNLHDPRITINHKENIQSLALSFAFQCIELVGAEEQQRCPDVTLNLIIEETCVSVIC